MAHPAVAGQNQPSAFFGTAPPIGGLDRARRPPHAGGERRGRQQPIQHARQDFHRCPRCADFPIRLRATPPAGVAYRQCSFRSSSFRGPPPLTGAFHGSQTWAAPTCRARGILSWASSEGSRKTDSRAQACFAISGTPDAFCSPSSEVRLGGAWNDQRLIEVNARRHRAWVS